MVLGIGIGIGISIGTGIGIGAWGRGLAGWCLSKRKCEIGERETEKAVVCRKLTHTTLFSLASLFVLFAVAAVFDVLATK